MSILRDLREKAQAAADSRGHCRIFWDAPSYWGGTPIRALQDGHCPVCKKTVHLNTAPPPNGVDIGGELVALNCAS